MISLPGSYLVVTTKRKVMKIVLIIFLLGLPCLLQGQSVTDSLHRRLQETGLPAKDRIDLMNSMAYHLRAATLDSALHYADEARRLSDIYEYPQGTCDAYVATSLLYWLKGLPERGLPNGLRALELSDSVGYTKGKMEACLVLASLYKDMKDVEKAEAYTQQGLDLAQALNHTEGLARSYNALGNYARMKKYEEQARTYYEKGLRYVANTDRYPMIKVILLNNLAYYYIKKKKDPIRVKQYLSEALRLSSLSKDVAGRLHTLIRQSQLARMQENYTEATLLLKEAEEKSEELGVPGARLDVYHEWIELYKLQQRPGMTAAYERKYNALRDSLFALERARQIAILETLYETEKKEKAIQQLEQGTRLRVIQQRMLIATVVIILIASLAIFLIQRSRTRKVRNLLAVQQSLNDKLRELDQYRSRFFANISHEFRTPLSLILAPAENALKKKNSIEDREDLLLIRRSANRLLELINQLLEIARLEAGKMELRVRRGDLKEWLSVIAESFNTLAHSKQIQFQCELSIPAETYWYDPDKLEKIIVNLLSNAFKYTPAKGIVSMHVKTESDLLSITVSDTGVGIPASEQARVFDPFYQVQQPDYATGSGLGLSLVKELVKVYQGTIELHSEPGQGTSFHVMIPFHRHQFSERQVIEESPEIILTNLRLRATEDAHELIREEEEVLNRPMVILAEDHGDLRQFMSATLQQRGYAVLTAADGDEAWNLILQYVPSLVLTDLMMPRTDGIQLTQKIKEDARTSHIPVVMLTARQESESRIEGLRTGADDYLTKPFSPDELLVRIQNLIEQRARLQEKFRERILVDPSRTEAVSLDDRFLLQARQVVESRLADHLFTVEMMADEMNLSRTQLLRKLKALTGLSPNDFIKDIRLKKAADMITQKVDTITQIGYAVGFNDQSYFTKCFKKKFGVTPTEFAGQTGRRNVHIL